MKKLIPFVLSGLFCVNLMAQNVFVEYAKDLPVGDYEFTDCNTSVKRSIHDPLNEGKVLMVIKMATWCPHCKANTKANFNKDSVAAVLKRYTKSKLEIWAMYDGPTDCNGARNALSECNLTGADVFFGVDNNDVDSKFFSSGVPTILVIDPKTKKSAFTNWESSSTFNVATKTIGQLLDNSFVFPTYGKEDNIVQFKPVKVSSTRNNREDACSGNYITDGKLGTAWQSDMNKSQGAWAMIDLGKSYLVTSVDMRIGNSNDSKKIQLQMSDSETGPWNTISELSPFNTILKFKINANAQGRYFRVVNAQANSGWILSVSDLYVKGTSTPLATEEYKMLEAIKVFPNPSSDIVNIIASESVDIDIISSNGNSVLSKNLESGQNTISLKELNQGLYLIRFKKLGISRDVKIIKN
jgi:thiol-disulfide isomerase/thioredoxin